MSIRFLAALTTVVLLAGMSWLPPAAGGPPGTEAPPVSPAPVEAAKLTPPEWTGKVLLVSCGSYAVAFENAQLRTVGGETWIVGKAVEDPLPSPANGRVTWVPMRKVDNIIEFASAKEYQKAAATRPAPVPAAVPAIPS